MSAAMPNARRRRAFQLIDCLDDHAARRPQIATFAPSCANLNTVALPIPSVLPVTTATLFFSPSSTSITPKKMTMYFSFQAPASAQLIDHSGLMPADLMTFAHFTISLRL